ncbi:hypothetical protein [Amycolatopsis tolypomycina]|uniref:hypothetical protein n=1 Tax=Amycolatopsis tolypomycina TaxID=208445 RepID=UPI0033A66E58
MTMALFVARHLGVCRPLLQAFERWDGRGVPGQAGGDELAPAMRLVHLADNVEAFHHTAGVEGALAVAVARERRGTQFDPRLVDSFLDRHATCSPASTRSGCGTR